MLKLSEKIDLTGYTLVLPAVAVGNVGQLAIDILISSTQMKKIGYVLSSGFIPIIGADPYSTESNDLCTSGDIYYDSDSKIVSIQIRSPPVKRLNKFFNDVKEFVKIEKIEKVIILTSAWSHTRNDAQIHTMPMRYIVSPIIEKNYGQKFKELNWLPLETEKNPFTNTEELSIPGGGFAKKLYDFFITNEIPSAILLVFCSEGDNVPDATGLIKYLSSWINIVVKQTKYPSSWEFLFGNPAPSDIY